MVAGQLPNEKLHRGFRKLAEAKLEHRNRNPLPEREEGRDAALEVEAVMIRLPPLQRRTRKTLRKRM